MIELTQDSDLWQVRINRPEKANSLTRDMLLELAEIAEQAHGKAKAFVLTGEGRVFSAGADLEEAKAGLAVDPVWERISEAIATLPCLSIAALNGTLAGGAFGMALACDMRFCVPGTKFFYPVMKLGFLPQPSDPTRMKALIGPARSKLILMGGAKITAEDALAFGLVDGIINGSELDPFVKSMCADTLAASVDHSIIIKLMCS